MQTIAHTANMGRQFFVGGNFKMYPTLPGSHFGNRAISNGRANTVVLDRNGSMKTITEIIHRLNDAKLDEKTGKSSSLLPLPLPVVPTPTRPI